MLKSPIQNISVYKSRKQITHDGLMCVLTSKMHHLKLIKFPFDD